MNVLSISPAEHSRTPPPTNRQLGYKTRQLIAPSAYANLTRAQ